MLSIRWLTPTLLEYWTASGKKQVITELELWPVVLGMQNLASFLHRRRVLWFNNAVKDLLVKGSTRGSNLFAMISEALHLAGLCGDYPSRGDSVTAAKLIDGVLGQDLQPSPDFVDVLLQSCSYDGCMPAKGDRQIV